MQVICANLTPAMENVRFFLADKSGKYHAAIGIFFSDSNNDTGYDTDIPTIGVAVARTKYRKNDLTGIRRAFRQTCCFSKKHLNHFRAFDVTSFYINFGFI